MTKALIFVASSLSTAWGSPLFSGEFAQRTSQGIDFQCESFIINDDVLAHSVEISGTFQYANSCANCDGEDCSFPADFSVMRHFINEPK